MQYSIRMHMCFFSFDLIDNAVSFNYIPSSKAGTTLEEKNADTTSEKSLPIIRMILLHKFNFNSTRLNTTSRRASSNSNFR